MAGKPHVNRKLCLPCHGATYGRIGAVARLANPALSKPRRIAPLPSRAGQPCRPVARGRRFLSHPTTTPIDSPRVPGIPGPPESESFNESVSTFRLWPGSAKPPSKAGAISR